MRQTRTDLQCKADFLPPIRQQQRGRPGTVFCINAAAQLHGQAHHVHAAIACCVMDDRAATIICFSDGTATLEGKAHSRHTCGKALVKNKLDGLFITRPQCTVQQVTVPSIYSRQGCALLHHKKSQ